MSATRLLVLGVVRMYGTAHGYQVRRELLSWSADKWAKVQPGSIYHALKKMAAEGLLEHVDTGRKGGGPDRTAYRLTEAGESEFQIGLARMLSTVDESPNSEELSAAVTFLPCLPREQAIGLLEYRLTQLDGQAANVGMVLERGTDWGHPEHVNELYRLWRLHVDADIRWTKDLLRRLSAGEYAMADDPEPSFDEPPTR
ncbi:Transcriptional regulator PadR-like family protein [Amycolatopsis arida]|uniref:Transcriptional regulator PadR-like family protein n=1 Tax=Amycolatopsis arida TaxID=587909 RepID=A0A1I5Q3T3_9PSEU|nr:PadR family transcriptional regulator [Amycolatopsis arida]TDX98707.1 PadR family transcriptional regulator [Amycolatopsis arida]SFP40872.1 Transcriptional regulator PadR-like family protein [Amycolatopsis arida]